MKWNTKLTRLLSIDYPIIEGAMAYMTTGKTAAAMAQAGGAGVLASGGFTIDQLQSEIAEFKDMAGENKIYGINLMLQNPHRDDVAELISDVKPPFITIGAGDPIPWMKDFQPLGIHCIPLVPNAELAARVQNAGADAVIVEGMEAGGHDGKLTTMSLLENTLPDIEIPVIAAGGISDGRGIAAALIMGASGVQIGTRFLLAEESPLHEKAKEALIKAKDTDSTVTGFTRNNSVRGLKSQFSEEYQKQEYNGAPDEILNEMATGTTPKGMVSGDLVHGYVLAGMSLNHLSKVEPTKDIMQQLVEETEKTLQKAPYLI